MEKAFEVKAENVNFLSVEKTNFSKTMKDFDFMAKKLESFLKILEKKFGEIIWYIGTDILQDEVTERFTFKQSGFMEIIIKHDTEIKAFFPQKEKAERFANALKKTFRKLQTHAKIIIN